MSTANAYFEGQDAWYGNSINPYQFHTDEWHAWERGWKDENRLQECRADTECE